MVFWRPIKTKGRRSHRYRISTEGVIWDREKDIEVPTYLSENRKTLYVDLEGRSGALIKRRVRVLMKRTFMPEPPRRGMRLGHRDGNPSNCALKNLVYWDPKNPDWSQYRKWLAHVQTSGRQLS